MANLQQTGGGGGGGGTTLTGTGIARNSGACTELSGDVTTSGTNAASVVKVNGAVVPTSAAVVGTNGSAQIIAVANQTANNVFAGPTTGVPAAPGFRALVAADIPNIAESQVTNLTTDLAAKQASLTGTGLARQSGACTELSGDVTTSGSNAATVVKVNGASVPVSATLLGSNGSGQLVDAIATSSLATLKTATLNLSSAQIKALFTTPVQIIAAPGAGLAINVWYVVWNYIAGGTGYASVTGTFQLADSGLHFTVAGVTGTNLGIANAATNGLSFQIGTINQSTDANYVGTSRVVWISTANPTTGNGTMTVKAFYTIDTVS